MALRLSQNISANLRRRPQVAEGENVAGRVRHRLLGAGFEPARTPPQDEVIPLNYPSGSSVFSGLARPTTTKTVILLCVSIHAAATPQI